MFSKSREEPPDMGMIMPKVGNRLGWLWTGFEFSSLSGGPVGGGGRLTWGWSLRVAAVLLEGLAVKDAS